MIEIPDYISTLFIFIVAVLVMYIYHILRTLVIKKVLILSLTCILIWLILQAYLSIRNVYSLGNDILPPKILLFGIIPSLAAVIFLFSTPIAILQIDKVSIKKLMYIHIVRVPVEVVLYMLFLNNTVPKLITFKGFNYDILAGITAPLVVYFIKKNNRMSYKIILLWNIISLFLLITVVFLAFFSTPSPVQKFAFDQPNIAILQFPFSWLPTFIVPVVLLAHLLVFKKIISIFKTVGVPKED